MDNYWTAAVDYDQYATKIQKRNADQLVNYIPKDVLYHHALDAGCGTGFVTAAMLKSLSVTAVTAVDQSAQMLAQAAHNLAPFSDKKINFLNQSIQDLSLSIPFNLIISNAVLHWTYPHIGDAIDHLAKLLKSGGYFAFTTAGRTLASDRFDSALTSAIRAVGGKIANPAFSHRRMSADEAIGLCQKAGLETIDALTIERTVQMTPSEYVTWAFSSGSAWEEIPSGKAALVNELASHADTFKMGHWSTLIVTRSNGRKYD